jgi:hypothetical protein
MGQPSGIYCIFGLGWSEMTKLLSPSFSCSVYRLGRDPLAYTLNGGFFTPNSSAGGNGGGGAGLEGGGGRGSFPHQSSCIKSKNPLYLLEPLLVKGRE